MNRALGKSFGLSLVAAVFAVQTVSAQTAAAPIKLELGAQYVGWDSTYSPSTPFNGSEVLVPLTLSADAFPGVKIYGQTEFAHGTYTDSANFNTETLNLTALSDTVLGFMGSFKSFSLPSIVNVGLNIPTGDPTWETKQGNSVIPTYLVDSDYRGRGWGLSAFYGLSLPAGNDQYGFAAGYLYSGAFNPFFDEGGPAEQLKLGDSVFLALNRTTDRGKGQMDIIRLSGFYFLPTQLNGSDLMELGPAANVSYAWQNPKAFSFEVGAQYFFPLQQEFGGQLSQEPYNSFGPRLYLAPSYVWGNWTFVGGIKYVLANAYPLDNPQYSALYVGGGLLLGLEPSYKVSLDKASSLRFSASFSYVDVFNGAYDASGNRADVAYGRWTLGTHYEVNF